MLKNISVLALIFVGLASSSPPTSLSSLQKYVNGWKKDDVLRNAAVSLYVYDLNRNLVLASLNPNMCLVPASTMKLMSTGTALEVLGSGYRFKTRIEYTGNIDSNGTLNGNIYIKGGGDPSLGSGLLFFF